LRSSAFFWPAWLLPLFLQWLAKNKKLLSANRSRNKGGSRNERNWKTANIAPILLLAGALVVAPGCAGGPLTTREKAASIGVLGRIGEAKP
jgi:hypothetical protein